MLFSQHLYKTLTSIFLLAMLAVTAMTYMVFVHGVKIDVDLKTLLPVDASAESVMNKVDQGMIDVLGDQLVVAIDTDDLPTGLRAAKALDKHVQENGYFSAYDINSSLELLNQQQNFLQAYSHHLLTQEQKRLLSQNPDDLLELAQMEIFDLAGVKSHLSLQQDPLRLFGGFWQQQIPESAAGFHDGRLVFSADGRHTIIFLLKLNTAASSIEVQEDIAAWTNTLQTYFAQEFPSIKLLLSGVIFHSAFATVTAQKEVSIIGFGSTLGVIILFLWAFRRIDILFLSVVSVGIGCFSAFVLVCFLFQEIHLIALVFGASLIGVAIDYSLHFISKLQVLTDHQSQHATVLKQLVLPMTLGLSTTLLSYACLFQSDLKVLNQIAVFSMMGLFISWLNVCVLYPVYFRKALPAQSPKIRFMANLPARFWQKKIHGWIVGIVCVLILLSGFHHFKLSDEVRTFYKPPAHLLESERYLQQKLNNISLHQYLLLRAPDTESLLQLEEDVRQSLDQLVTNGDLGSYVALSQQVPSVTMQKTNRQLLEKNIYQEGALLDQLNASLDLDDEFSIKAREEFENNRNFLQLNDWIQYARPDQKILWVGDLGKEVASIIAFKSINNIKPLQALSNSHSILFVDKVDSISNAIDQLTSQAIKWLLVSYVLIFILLAIYFRRLSVLVLPLIPLMSTLLALSLLSSFSIPINLFHIFGCYLILGFGFDYAIFYFFDKKKDSATQYGNFLAAMTNIMSFGFLAFSSTPMVQSFGLILLLGCTLSLLISPLASRVSNKGVST